MRRILGLREPRLRIKTVDSMMILNMRFEIGIACLCVRAVLAVEKKTVLLISLRFMGFAFSYIFFDGPFDKLTPRM